MVGLANTKVSVFVLFKTIIFLKFLLLFNTIILFISQMHTQAKQAPSSKFKMDVDNTRPIIFFSVYFCLLTGHALFGIETVFASSAKTPSPPRTLTSSCWTNAFTEFIGIVWQIYSVARLLTLSWSVQSAKMFLETKQVKAQEFILKGEMKLYLKIYILNIH